MNNTSNFIGDLSLLSDAKTRSISPENFSGGKGKGGMATEGAGKEPSRELGVGWKVSPSIIVDAHSSVTLAEIDGPGVIQHIWLTCVPEHWRTTVLRMYWDGEEHPSVEVPLGDFFCNGWSQRSNVNSFPIAVNPAGGMNSYWGMPFKKSAKITVENLTKIDYALYYQIDYSLEAVPENAGYFHAQWRRSNPNSYKKDHILVDNIEGKGHYVGTYMAWGVNNNGWWGEGELKFYLDGDEEYPTICGTGTEDYFGGAWNFEQPLGSYGEYSTPFLGMPQVIKPDGLYQSQQRFGMYRWHIMDPIRFEENLKVTVQALGWRSEGRYLPLQDDIASTTFWYQKEPHKPYCLNLDVAHLEVN